MMDAPAAGLGAQEREIIEALAAAEKKTVTVDDVLEVQSISRNYANRVLARLAEKGWMVRLRRGVYAIVPLGAAPGEASIDDPWPLAMSLFSPAYIAGWTAAEHWDLTDQIFNSIAVVTARSLRARQQVVAGVTFLCRSVDERLLFGTKRVWSDSTPILISDPHRTIIDVLAVPELGGGGRHSLDIVQAYWRSKHADPAKLLDYAERFGKGVVFKRLGFTAEALGRPDEAWLRRCESGLSKGVSLLDPDGPKRGRMSTRWRLRVNIPVGAA